MSEIKVSARVSANSFGTFLETVNPAMQARASEEAARRVLSLISTEPKPVFELLLNSELSISEFSAALDHLQKIGVIDRSGAGKDEKVRLAPTIIRSAAE